MKVLIAITGYEFFDYTARAIRSALACTKDCCVVVIDDCSPSWPSNGLKDGKYLPDELQEWDNQDKVGFVRFDTNYGLTRSMNAAVAIGKTPKHDYTVISNNDVIFTPGWFDAIEYALNNGYDIAGPITNAPGPTAGGLQDVTRYVPEYRLTDDEIYLASLSQRISHHKESPIESRVNGFCFAARTETWMTYAHNQATGEVFKLEATHNSKGQRNPTPRASLMEDLYQNRMYEQGGKSAVCPGSFVFHYRSVWRGDKYKQGQWYRATDK